VDNKQEGGDSYQKTRDKNGKADLKILYKKEEKMKKILGLTIAALLVMGLVGGGTWAYFSDPENVTGNTIAAGTINLQVGASDPTSETFTVSSGVPGDNVTYTWALDNSGDVNAFLDIAFTNLVNDDDSNVEPEVSAGDSDNGTGQGELAETIDILVWIETTNNDVYDSGTDTLIFMDKGTGGTTELTAAVVDDYALNPATSAWFCFEWGIDTTIGNTIMGDDFGIDVEFSLEQIAD